MNVLREDNNSSRSRIRAKRWFAPIAAVSLLTIALLAASTAVFADQLDAIRQFNIPAEKLDKALLQFGTQAHLQLSISLGRNNYDTETRPLRGRYAERKALALLLIGSGLRYHLHGLTVEIRQARTPRSAAAAAKAKHFRSSTDSGASARPRDPSAAQHSSLHGGAGELAWLREVTVTAQKYRQRAFDVPIDLDVLAGRDLSRLNITSVNDLQYYVSGLYVEGGAVYHYIVLRGVSNESGNGALVGEYIDNADITAEGYAGESGYGTGDIQLYDLKRVEVLKGPQGTLYGDGAMGGVIRYITNKPVMGEYEFGADVSALFTQYGAPSQRTETMLNIPLVGHTLALRIAGQFEHEGGWVDEPAADLKNINSMNLTDARIEAQWKPSADFKALATQVVHRESYGIGLGETAAGEIAPAFGITSVPHGEQSMDLSNLSMTADFPMAEIVSSSTYLKHSEETHYLSFLAGPEVGLESNVPLSNEAFSEELRVHSTMQSRWEWTLGAFYKHYRDAQATTEYFGLSGPLSAATSYDLIGNSDRSNDVAAFADTDVRVLRRLTLGAGIRYFRSSFRIHTQGALIDGVPLVQPNSAQESFTSKDPRFYIQYRLSSHINTYASAAKGFRSGEPNLGLYRGFDPESLWSYDLGEKARFLQGRLRSDADIFYEKYSNYVGEGLVTIYGVPEFGSFNIGAARIKGVDADMAWLMDDRWRLNAKAELVNAKFVSIRRASAIRSGIYVRRLCGADVSLGPETGVRSGQLLPNGESGWLFFSLDPIGCHSLPESQGRGAVELESQACPVCAESAERPGIPGSELERGIGLAPATQDIWHRVRRVVRIGTAACGRRRARRAEWSERGQADRATVTSFSGRGCAATHRNDVGLAGRSVRAQAGMDHSGHRPDQAHCRHSGAGAAASRGVHSQGACACG
jgi:iron complex outermembrane receptor protein